MTNNEPTITASDADFIARVGAASTSTGLHLERGDRRRFKRLRELGYVLGGRLDPDRYAVLTPKGRAFVAGYHADRDRGQR